MINNKKKNEGYKKDVEDDDNQEGDDKTDDLMNEKNQYVSISSCVTGSKEQCLNVHYMKSDGWIVRFF